VLTNQTVTNYFKILDNACKYSSRTANKIFGESSLLKDLRAFLPCEKGNSNSVNQEEFPFINETIGLLNSVFGDKEEKVEESKKSERTKQRRAAEKVKRDFQMTPDSRSHVANAAEFLLPRVFFVYEQSINS
jgi:phage terminase small subunit